MKPKTIEDAKYNFSFKMWGLNFPNYECDKCCYESQGP